MIHDKLKYVFKHYKKEYKLNSKFKINERSTNFSFNHGENKINIGLGIRDYHFSEIDISVIPCPVRNMNEILLYATLHEIKHAIDNHTMRLKYFTERMFRDNLLYHINREYHDNQPYEIRAEKFAISELPKWGYLLNDNNSKSY